MNIGIIGLGYVGVPLAVAFAEEGHQVIGVDVDRRKVDSLSEGRSYIEDIPDERLQGVLEAFRPTTRWAELARVDAMLICVPTPLTRNREPDLGPLTACYVLLSILTAAAIQKLPDRLPAEPARSRPPEPVPA